MPAQWRLLRRGRSWAGFRSMEFGARALGNRSILADPRRKDMRRFSTAASSIANRSGRSVRQILSERVGEYFETDYPRHRWWRHTKISLKARASGSRGGYACVMGPGGSPLVERVVTPRYRELIHKFEEVTGVPVLPDTSSRECDNRPNAGRSDRHRPRNADGRCRRSAGSICIGRNGAFHRKPDGVCRVTDRGE